MKTEARIKPFGLIWLSLLCVTASTLIGCKTLTIAGHYTSSTMEIDGQMFDWADIPYTTFDDEGAVLRLCNDQKNLYLYLRLKDAKMAGLIRRTGLKLWLDPTAGKKENTSLQYYGGPTPEELQEMGMEMPGGMAGKMPTDRQRQMEGEARRPEDSFVYCDRKKIIEVVIPQDGSVGPAVTYDGSRGLFSYEFKIPLSDSLYGLGASLGQEVCIGAEWGDPGEMRNAMKRPGGMGGDMGGGRGGMGGGRGGGMGGGRGGMRPRNI